MFRFLQNLSTCEAKSYQEFIRLAEATKAYVIVEMRYKADPRTTVEATQAPGTFQHSLMLTATPHKGRKITYELPCFNRFGSMLELADYESRRNAAIRFTLYAERALIDLRSWLRYPSTVSYINSSGAFVNEAFFEENREKAKTRGISIE